MRLAIAIINISIKITTKIVITLIINYFKVARVVNLKLVFTD